jgi:hypothetical protein
MEILLAVVIGAAFGAALDRVGATDPTWIGRMLGLHHLHLAKTILAAIGTASILMFLGQMAGLVEVGHMSVKSAHLGVILGGAIMGVGWAVSGFCPGTGIAAAASGRRDAMVFVVGGLIGAALYILSDPAVSAAGLLDPLFGGKTTLGVVPGAEAGGLFAVRGDVVGLVVGIVFIAIAAVLPQTPRHGGEAVPAE